MSWATATHDAPVLLHGLQPHVRGRGHAQQALVGVCHPHALPPAPTEKKKGKNKKKNKKKGKHSDLFPPKRKKLGAPAALRPRIPSWIFLYLPQLLILTPACPCILMSSTCSCLRLLLTMSSCPCALLLFCPFSSCVLAFISPCFVTVPGLNDAHDGWHKRDDDGGGREVRLLAQVAEHRQGRAHRLGAAHQLRIPWPKQSRNTPGRANHQPRPPGLTSSRARG